MSILGWFVAVALAGTGLAMLATLWGIWQSLLTTRSERLGDGGPLTVLISVGFTLVMVGGFGSIVALLMTIP